MAISYVDLDSRTRAEPLQSPQTPSVALKSSRRLSTSYPDKSYFSTDADIKRSSRKRSRNDSLSHETSEQAFPSPSPFANMHYRLAGGLDTPTAVTSQYSIYDSVTPDLAFRRGRPYISNERNDYFNENGDDEMRRMPGKDGNGRAPLSTYQPAQSTWGSLVFSLAGKVFNFCTVGTFQGFFSGGGSHHHFRPETGSPQLKSPSRGLEEGEWLDIPTQSSWEIENDTSRAIKKSKTDHDGAWVMVQDYKDSPPLKTRPSLLPRPTSSASPVSRSPTRLSTTASTAMLGRSSKRPISNLQRTVSTRTASSAGLRSPNPKISPPDTPVDRPHRRTDSFKSTHVSSHQRRNSYTVSSGSKAQTKAKVTRTPGTISPHHSVHSHDQSESPLAKETRQHLERVQKSQMEEDFEIMKMNRQLKDLIQQGKEALGTRIEVDFEEKQDW